ncbi:MAG: aminotransferase class I/II-fold pyridoxal phosphate-dependent enzyme, partial [Clostridia bacterium]|nr:aminotransferase class I/II-fold pyridoxal phosphate-dependent enzyme [Clostridia bacterium]
MFDKRYTADCRIYNMLNAAPTHLSFHTPGHKRGKWDITELSFSDNLSNPTGVLKEAQTDIARILGAQKSFILTDGSTSGVLSMLYASGVKKLVFAACSHKSVYNGCKLLKIEKVVLQNRYAYSLLQQPTAEEIERALKESNADGVLITSPDYYGNVADLKGIRAVCEKYGACLLCDGAHGGHLHGTPLYAGVYCDFWVDGVHKSLPALTQGAIVSAKSQTGAQRLAEGVDIFRTTSPNYLIMASVEYAVKYPKKQSVIKAAQKLKKDLGAYENADWTKVVLCYGKNAKNVHTYLENQGVYPEFCDGENIMFYLSSATKLTEIKRLKELLFPL